MSVTVSEIPEGRQFGVTEDHQSTYTRVFHAETSNPRIGPVQVKAALGLAIGQIYSIGTPAVEEDPLADPPVVGVPASEDFEEDPGAVLLGVEGATSSADGRQWTITASYGPWTDRPREENPLDEPEEFDVGGEERVKAADVDRDGNPVVNSAFDPFDPPVEMDDPRTTFTITRNQATFTRAQASALRNTVNAALAEGGFEETFFDFAPGTVKLGIITAVRKWHAKVPGHWYWTVRYPFAVNEDGWAARPLDQGLRKLVDEGEDPDIVTVRKQIYVEGALATSPMLLDGDGSPLEPDDEPFYHEYHVYREADFHALNFTGAKTETPPPPGP